MKGEAVQARAETRIQARLKDAARPAMVQAAPGRWVPANGKVPEVSLCKWRQEADGSWTPLPFTERLVRLDAQLAAVLGFGGRQYQTLRRLGAAGFVEMIQIAPRVVLINLDSYCNHLRRCAEDPFFWSTGGRNLDEYRKAI